MEDFLYRISFIKSVNKRVDIHDTLSNKTEKSNMIDPQGSYY